MSEAEPFVLPEQEPWTDQELEKIAEDLRVPW